MPLIDHMTRPFNPECAYHVYNRANGPDGKLFFNDGNYDYFLRKFFEYGNGYWKLYAYALLPNHFHVLIHTLPVDDVLHKAIADFGRVSKHFVSRQLTEFHVYEQNIRKIVGLRSTHTDLKDREVQEIEIRLYRWIISERLRRFALGYAKAVNRQQKRYGSLFQKVFRRKLIKPEDLCNMVMYIHRNPIHHGLVESFSDSLHTSYAHLLAGTSHVVANEEVLRFFNGKDGFIAKHTAYLEYWRNHSQEPENVPVNIRDASYVK